MNTKWREPRLETETVIAALTLFEFPPAAAADGMRVGSCSKYSPRSYDLALRSWRGVTGRYFRA